MLRRSQDVRGTMCEQTPLSEYPRNPRILGWSKDVPGTICAWSPLSEYPRIPGILGQSQDVPGTMCVWTPLSEYPRIPGILGQSQDTRMISGCSWDHLCKDPYVWVSQESQELGQSQDVPGTICVTICVITPLSDYPRIPGILRQSQDVPGTMCVWTPLSEYPRIPGILGRS